MKAWLSMMPVSAESSAATQLSAGSIARAALPPRNSSPSTPLISPCLAMPSILAVCFSSTATISLPTFLCGTPCEAQKSYSMRRPCTQCFARCEPVG